MIYSGTVYERFSVTEGVPVVPPSFCAHDLCTYINSIPYIHICGEFHFTEVPVQPFLNITSLAVFMFVDFDIVRYYSKYMEKLNST
jgi:hypothetical protein